MSIAAGNSRPYPCLPCPIPAPRPWPTSYPGNQAPTTRPKVGGEVMEMDGVTIGARLRTLRRWRGLTQVELADRAGVSASYISMVEHGERLLDRRSHIAAIAAALRVSETD